ncbi:MAG: glycosyltransferase [Thermoplasmatota archaeon]
MEAPQVLFTVPHHHSFIQAQLAALGPSLGPSRAYVRHNRATELARWLPRGLPGAGLGQHAWKNLVAGPPSANIEVRPASFTWPLRDSRSPDLGLRMARSIEPQLGDWAPDLVHAHFLALPAVAGRALAARRQVPLVITAHGYDVYDLPFRGNGWRPRVDACLEAAAHIITVSERNRRILIDRLGVAPEKVTRIPNGFDPRLFKPAPAAGLGTARSILAVGNLVPIKGCDDLLDAFALLAARDPAARLVWIGDGPLRPHLDRRIQSMGLAGRISMLGRLSHEEVAKWMVRADLFVLASHDEGNPTVVAEALGCGMPVVATDVGGVREVVEPRSGVLVPPQRPDLLAQALDEALERTWDRQAISVTAQKLAWPHLMAQVRSIYDLVTDAA